MTNHQGYRGKPWTDAEVIKLAEMMDDGSTVHWISLTLNRSISSIEGKIRSIRQIREMGAILGPGLARYERPEAIESHDEDHLARILSARPCGFPVAFSRPHCRVPA